MWRRTAGHTVLITGFTPECVQQVLSTVKAMSHWHELGHRRRRRGALCVALTLPAWFGVLSVCNLSSSVRFPICRLKQSEISEACSLLSEWNVMVQGWSATLFTTLHRNLCSMSSMKLWNYSLFEERRCCQMTHVFYQQYLWTGCRYHYTECKPMAFYFSPTYKTW